MEPLSLEYFAGLFDGEGSVSIIKSLSKGKLYHKLVLQLSMCNRQLIEAICASFGGWVFKINRSTKRGKIPYKWMLQGSQAAELLLALQPFLRCKACLVPLAVEFQQTMGQGRNRKRHALAAEVWQRREEIRQQVITINARD